METAGRKNEGNVLHIYTYILGHGPWAWVTGSRGRDPWSTLMGRAALRGEAMGLQHHDSGLREEKSEAVA